MKETILKHVAPWIIESVKRQGFSWLLTALAVWFFYNQTQTMQQKIDDCNNTIIEMYQNDRETLIKVLQTNTDALEKLNNCK
jgi:phosphoglycerate-specific signal transduction histidine kinase